MKHRKKNKTLSKGDDKIKDIFQDAFESFEAPVKPSAWSGIESGMNAGAGSGAAGGSSLGSWVSANVGWVASGIVAVSAAAIIAVAAIGDQPEEIQPEPVTEQVVKQDSKDNSSAMDQTPSQEKNTENEESAQSEKLEKSNGVASEREEATGSSKPTSTNSAPDSKPTVEAETRSQKSSNQNEATNSASSEKTDSATGSASANKSSEGGATEQSSVSNEESEITSEPTAELSAQFRITSSNDSPLRISLRADAANADEYKWTFGDGKTVVTTVPQVDHVFTKQGEYLVQLKVLREESTVSSSQKIEVFGRPELVLPNVFTPNGDDINDSFTIDQDESKNIESYTLRVFTLDGEQIFQSHSDQISWNGEMPNGAPAPEGKYVVSVKAIGTNGKSLRAQQKVITLTR